MSETGGWGEDAPRPYFFLSYARTPASSAVGAGDPNHYVHQLYKDLCRTILEITDLPQGEPPGFMDRGMHLGEGWSEKLSEALAHCRVFVPLYSPRYFRSLACGQEWAAFAERPVYQRQRSGSHASGVVPALWVTVPADGLPQVARRLQFNHTDFGPDYVNEGLFALMKLRYFREAYELAVHRLAQRIVQVADQTMIPPGRKDDFQSRPSAFDTPEARQLRISVLACATDRLPDGRAPHTYGSRSTDWQPYQPGPGRALAEHAARLARQLDFHPSVHEFEDEIEELTQTKEPTAPGLLLLDRWALLDPERRGLAQRFDERNPSWVSLLEPWCENDPERPVGDAVLKELAQKVLRSRRRDAKPTFQGAMNGLPTLQSFEEEFPRAAQRAMQAFEDRRHPAFPPKGPSAPRPSFRDLRPPPDTTTSTGRDDPWQQQHLGTGGGTP